MQATLERPRATGRVDRQRGIIRSVKVIGAESANARSYSSAALADIARLAEGAAVNVDHVEPGQRRSYRDRIGSLTEIEVRPDGVYGTLRVNRAHPLAEQLFDDAENSPRSVGLSVDARGDVERQGGKLVVTSVSRLLSVDVVANPAATAGLFESLPADLSEVRSPFAAPSRVLAGARAGRWREEPEPVAVTRPAALAEDVGGGLPPRPRQHVSVARGRATAWRT